MTTPNTQAQTIAHPIITVIMHPIRTGSRKIFRRLASSIVPWNGTTTGGNDASIPRRPVASETVTAYGFCDSFFDGSIESLCILK